MQTYKTIQFSSSVLYDQKALETLAEWRNANLNTFVNNTPVTTKSTHTWLTKLLATRDQSLWWMAGPSIFDPIVGHIGINFSKSPIELGYVLRGRPEFPGIFSQKVASFLGIYRHLGLLVKDDNEHAIRFYFRNNFTIKTTVPESYRPNLQGHIYMEASC